MKIVQYLLVSSILILVSCQTVEEKSVYTFQKGPYKLLLQLGSIVSGGEVIPTKTVYYYENDKRIFKGMPYKINKSLIYGMLSEIYKERKRYDVGVYGFRLGSSIELYDQLKPFVSQIENERNLIRLPAGEYGWDGFVLGVDKGGIIQNISLHKFFESSRSNDQFFNEVRNILENKYVKVFSSNQEIYRRGGENQINRKFDTLRIQGLQNYEEFLSYAEVKIKSEFWLRGLPDLERALGCIINDHLQNITLIKFPSGSEFSINGDTRPKVTLTIKSSSWDSSKMAPYEFNSEDF